MMYRVNTAALAILFSVSVSQADESTPICTDRPTKSNSVCTVPEGHFQLESDLFSYTYHHKDNGETSKTWTAPNLTLKYGVNEKSDVEVIWAGWNQTKESHGHSMNSIGDVYVRYKYQLTDPDADNKFGLIPYVKIPTARDGFGNNHFEGGAALPINLSLPYEVTLTLGPQVDMLLDEDENGYHVNLVNMINLSKSVTSKLTLIGEFWMDNNFDPDGTSTQTSADFAAAYLITPKVQIDVGSNIGLNDHTPDYQLYTGLSIGF